MQLMIPTFLINIKILTKAPIQRHPTVQLLSVISTLTMLPLPLTDWRSYTRRLVTTNRKPLAYGSCLAKVSERLHSHIPSDCKVTWVYVPIYMSICGTRSGWRQCSYEVEGLPDACHIKQASGSSLPVPIFIGRWTDHINLQAEVTKSGMKMFPHMVGHEWLWWISGNFIKPV